MNLFSIVYTFKNSQEPEYKGHALYSRKVNAMLLILYKGDRKLIDCKSLKLDDFNPNPSVKDIEEVAQAFIIGRHGEDYIIEEAEEWKNIKATI